MLLEGTSIYFWLIILVFLIVYITVKICLGNLLKRAKQEAWKGYVPFYTTYVLVDLLGLKKSVFYMSLIPFVNLYYYNIIVAKLLEGFNLNPKDSIWYIVIPMYKFPELVFRRPKFKLNEYDLTNEFIETQNALFNKSQDELPDSIELIDVHKEIEKKMEQEANSYTTDSGIVIEPNNYNQTINDVGSIYNDNAENVYTHNTTEEEEKQMTYVEAPEPEEEKVQKPIIQPFEEGRGKVCPNCGTKLAPGATTCFMCGHHFN